MPAQWPLLRRRHSRRRLSRPAPSAVLTPILLLAVVWLTGCDAVKSAATPWIPHSAGQPAAAAPLPPAAPPPITVSPRPPDRDPAAVDAALAQLDPCALLEPHLRANPKNRAVQEGSDHRTCSLKRAGLTPLEDAVRGERFTVLVGHSWKTGDRYAMEPIVIDGVRAYRFQDLDRGNKLCEIVIPLSFTRGIQVKYSRDTSDATFCAVIEDTLAGIVGVVRASPHGALLFTPEDNDSGLVGYCAHLAVADIGGPSCEPYQPVDIPSDPHALLSTGDTRTQCAVANEAIQRHFGDHLRPIMWGEHCFYVEPTHQLTITVNLLIDEDSIPGSYGHGWADPVPGIVTMDIGGRPAATMYFNGATAYDIYWSPFGDLSAPGGVHIGLEVREPRGFFTRSRPTVSTEQVAAAINCMTDIAAEYFPV